MERTNLTKIIDWPHFETVCRTISRRFGEFMSYSNVHHVGISKKFVKSHRNTHTSITFYVTKKTSKNISKMIPKTIDLEYKSAGQSRAIRTDVCEIGEEPIALSLRGGHFIVSSDDEFGTIGIVFTSENRDYLVTNAHVVTDPGRVPGPITVKDNNGVQFVGNVLRYTDLNGDRLTNDAALVEMPVNSVEPWKFRGTELILQGYTEIKINDPRKFYFVSGQFIFEAIWLATINECATVKVDGVYRTFCSFHKLKVTVGHPKSGNSGAVVFCESNNGLLAAGLLFAGIPADDEIWVFPAKRSIEALSA